MVLVGGGGEIVKYNKKNQGSQPQLKIRKPVVKELNKDQLINHIEMRQPASVRFFHWGFAFSLIAIILTGLILHQPLPFLALPYGKVFVMHVGFGWLASAFFIFRLVDMLMHKDNALLLSWQDIKNLPKVFAYYFYLRSNLPPYGQYNSGQKVIFTSWFLLFPFLVFISLASYWAGERLDWVIKLLEGIQVLRIIKYFGAIYFASTIILHIYLALTENLSRLQSMVTGYEQKNSEKSPAYQRPDYHTKR